MRERVKIIRKELRLTQAEFAEHLDVKGNYIYMVESGKTPVSDRLISAICREFKVSSEWLRTGHGEMFRSMSRNEELLKYIETVLDSPTTDIQHRIISVMAAMSPSHWSAIEEIVNLFVNTPDELESPSQREARLLREEAAAVEQDAEKSSASHWPKDA